MISPHHSIDTPTPARSAPGAAPHAAASHAPQTRYGARLGGITPLSSPATQAVFAAPPAAQMRQSAPGLPDPEGDTASAEGVWRCVNRVDDEASMSMFAVLQTITEMRQSDMVLAQLIKRMRTQALMLSKLRDLRDKADEIKASNTSATNRLVGSSLATGLSIVAAYHLRYQDLGINQATTGAFDYWDRNYGGQSRANQAILEQKHEQTVGQQEQMHVDAANAFFEQVKEARKSAQQAIMAHVQMVGDAVNNVWR